MGVFSRRNGRRLLAVGALAAATAAVPAAMASPWENTVRAGSLGHSLANVIGDTPRPWCTSDGPGRWTCAVPDPRGGAVARYRLHADGRCWRGHRVGHHGANLPASVHGCVGMWDQLRLADRL